MAARRSIFQAQWSEFAPKALVNQVWRDAGGDEAEAVRRLERAKLAADNNELENEEDTQERYNGRDSGGKKKIRLALKRDRMSAP